MRGHCAASHSGCAIVRTLDNICCFRFFWVTAILTGVRGHLTVVLICISPMISDVEHLFMYLFGHLCMFFGEMSLQTLCPFLIMLAFLLLLFSYWNSLNILDSNPLTPCFDVLFHSAHLTYTWAGGRTVIFSPSESPSQTVLGPRPF